MHKDMSAMTASGATSAAGVASSWWLWLIGHSGADFVTTLTALLIVSQLFWGWRKFFKGERA